MSDNIIKFPETETPKEDWIIGPFEEYRCVIEGRKIPMLEARRVSDGVNLIVDNRFCVCVPEDIAESVAWLLAQALAVGSGYASLSQPTKDRCFAPLCSRIGSVTTTEDTP